MNVEDIEVKVKKYDREKQVVIVYLVIFRKLEIRGFRVRYGRTKHSPTASVWIVSPPAVKTGKIYFWIIRFTDGDLWNTLQGKIIAAAQEYTKSYI